MQKARLNDPATERRIVEHFLSVPERHRTWQRGRSLKKTKHQEQNHEGV
jgi:hypothetical protein